MTNNGDGLQRVIDGTIAGAEIGPRVSASPGWCNLMDALKKSLDALT
jgi:hypothetical protein